MRKSVLVKKVPIPVIKGVIPIVSDFQQTILYPEGVGEIVTSLIAPYLGRPPLQIPAVKQLNPFAFRVLFRLTAGQDHQEQEQEPAPFKCIILLHNLGSYWFQKVKITLFPVSQVLTTGKRADSKTGVEER